MVDIGEVWEEKVEAVVKLPTRASSMPAQPRATRASTSCSGSDILQRMETKARTYGELIKVRYGEPLFSMGPVACPDPAGWFAGNP